MKKTNSISAQVWKDAQEWWDRRTPEQKLAIARILTARYKKQWLVAAPNPKHPRVRADGYRKSLIIRAYLQAPNKEM